MPKTKDLEVKKNKKIEPKEVDETAEKEIDPEGILGDALIDEETDDEDVSVMDDDDINPFKDKWEE